MRLKSACGLSQPMPPLTGAALAADAASRSHRLSGWLPVRSYLSVSSASASSSQAGISASVVLASCTRRESLRRALSLSRTGESLTRPAGSAGSLGSPAASAGPVPMLPASRTGSDPISPAQFSDLQWRPAGNLTWDDTTPHPSDARTTHQTGKING